MIAEIQEKLNDPNIVSIRETFFTQLELLFNGKTSESVFFLNGITGHSSANPYTETEKWTEESLYSLTSQIDRIKDRLVFRPLVIEYAPYGVHFIDKILGAKVYHYEGQWWSDFLKSPVGTLEPPDLKTNETWLLAKGVADYFLKLGVTVPIFGLPTIASALNIAINLYGEGFLLAMYLKPESARNDLLVINNLLCQLHRWYLENIPLMQLQPIVAAGRCQPHGFGQLCGCSCHMLSPKMYQEFIAPLDDELLSVYPHGGMIHLCGCHTQHIPVWREMKSLRSVQVNDRAAEDLEIYFKELRDDQIIYLNPTSTMTIERAIQITGGIRLVIVADTNKKYSIIE